MHLFDVSLFGICRAGSPRVNTSFFAAGCCGAAGCAGALLAAPEGSGGLALGSGAALLAAGLLGEGAAFAAAWGGAGSLPDAAAAELQCRIFLRRVVSFPSCAAADSFLAYLKIVSRPGLGSRSHVTAPSHEPHEDVTRMQWS